MSICIAIIIFWPQWEYKKYMFDAGILVTIIEASEIDLQCCKCWEYASSFQQGAVK